MPDCRYDSHRFRRLGCLLPAAAAVLLAIGGAAAQDEGDKPVPAKRSLKQPAATPQETQGQQPAATPSESLGRGRVLGGTPMSAGATSQPTGTRVVKIINVKNTNASTLAKSLSQIEPVCRIVADDRTNTLIVDGPADNDIAKLEKLIAQIDVPPSPVKQPEIRIYKIRNRPADGSLQNLLSEALGLGRGRVFSPGTATTATIVTDPLRGLVIVSGDEEIQKNIQQLISELDQPVSANKPAGANMKVRIVWLMAGPKTDSLPAAPADLKDVVEELTGIGVPQPRMAAQFVIQANTEEGFEMSAPVTTVAEQACNLQVMGDYSDWPSDKPTLNLRIVAAKLGQEDPHAPTDRTSGGGGMGGGMGATPREELWSIKTTMSAPVGHAVVLGVSPTGNTTSAFVVQVLPK